MADEQERRTTGKGDAMSSIEVLQMIEDERRRAVRRSELVRAVRAGRVHRRAFGDRIGRWIGGGGRA
jgi:hypothetical protein